VNAAPTEAASAATAELPLSARQTLLWLDEHLFPEARYHNLVLTVELRGPLDVERLSRAWADIARSRDALQVVIDPRTPRQRWVEAPPPALPVVPVEPGREQGWIAARSARQLLAGGLPWDAALLRSSADAHVFYLNQHHAISDGASMLHLVRELAGRYAGEAPPPAASFRDYLRSEAEYRASRRAEEDRAHWSSVLAGGAPPLRPYGLVRTDRSTALVRCPVELGEVGTRLAAAAQGGAFAAVSAGLSRLLVLATGFGAYLARVTGDREVFLGVPIANRTGRFAGTCGLLMEQVFLKVKIEEEDTFASLGARIRQETNAALRRGRSCTSDRGLGFATLNVLPAPTVRFAGLDAVVRLEPAAVLGGGGAGDARETIGLQVEEDPQGGLSLWLDLHRATFDEATRRRACGHLRRMLAALAEDPGARIDAVDLLGEEERRAVLAAARGPQPAGDPPDLVHRVAEQARRRADHVAVVAADATLRYADLDARSNQLARRLRAMGVQPGSRVGVAVPRGAGELVSLLAVLKAGGAYVPVDPSHPVQRVAVILEDAAPDVLIAPTGSPLAAAMPPGTALLALDDLARAAEGWDAAPLGEPCAPGQVAYVLFTSGSTGRPKGVEVPRDAFASFLRSMARTPGLTEDDRVLAVTTTTFDIAGLELFLPLWVGASVVVADREVAADPRRLIELMGRERVTMMQATPATWRLLLDAGWAGDKRLRVLCGGEAMSPELAAELLARAGEVWNMYGPTETTVWSTLDRVAAGGKITVGRPIDATDVYVLDPALRPAPAGVVGEIYIGGRGVARGYRGRPDLTAERFLPDPFREPGARMYRTGDLGRLLPDGRLECLGRVDHQVKIRGFRIELGEIESALRAVPGVDEVVVVAEPQAASPRLVAYWVGPAERGALYDRARATLPPYMVPSAYVGLPAFPLTTSGKVDRKALPRAEEVPAARADGRRPANDLETQVAAIWAEILGQESVGVDQDFFALGGTSVLVVQARARLERELGVEVPLRVFFDAPTVEGLVRQLGQPSDPDAPVVVTLRRGKPGSPPIFCLLGIQLYVDLALALEGDRPVVGVHVPMRYQPGAEPCPPLTEIARRYVEVIQARQPAGPYSLVGLCFGGIVAYEAARQLEAAGERVALVGVLDGNLPRGVRVHRAARLFEGVRRVMSDPAALRRAIAKRLRRAPAAPAAPGARVDLPIDGPEIEQEALALERRIGRLRAHLVVFRTTDRSWPAGTRVAADLGWGGAAERLTVEAVHSGHLELMHPPHVVKVAAVLDPALRAGHAAASPEAVPSAVTAAGRA
jgi:amino acid adenylation domain-containing protein